MTNIIKVENNLLEVDKEPRYDHPCPRCKFMGRYKEFDIYFCSCGPNLVYIVGHAYYIKQFKDIWGEEMNPLVDPETPNTQTSVVVYLTRNEKEIVRKMSGGKSMSRYLLDLHKRNVQEVKTWKKKTGGTYLSLIHI